MLRRFLRALAGPAPTTDPPVVVLSDLEPARRRLAEAIGAADERTRPGLEQAAGLLDAVRPADDDLVLTWARRLLDDSGIDPRTDEVGAVRRIRTAVPGLMPLLPAAVLVRRVVDAAAPPPVP